MDLAPNYAGTMMGITNTIGNFAGFVAPYITGLIIDGQVHKNLYLKKTKKQKFSEKFNSTLISFYQQTQAAWRTAFLISSGIFVVFSTLFVLFGSAEVQPWNTYWENSLSAKRTKRRKPSQYSVEISSQVKEEN